MDSQTLVPAKVKHFTDLGHDVQGIVHVGIHEGQELPWYLHMNHVPILGFEPNPDAAEVAAEFEVAHPEKVMIFRLALGDETGLQSLWIPKNLHDESDDSQSASLLRADHSSPYPWGDRDKEGREVETRVMRYDEWFNLMTASKQEMFAAINTLVVDVQGMELQVLRGFGNELRHFKYLVVECSEVPIYEGEVPARDVVNWLREERFSTITPIESHDDILFVRSG